MSSIRRVPLPFLAGALCALAVIAGAALLAGRAPSPHVSAERRDPGAERSPVLCADRDEPRTAAMAAACTDGGAAAAGGGRRRVRISVRPVPVPVP